MYANGRFFPPEYYKCTTNNIKRSRNWFCNKPLSPMKDVQITISSDENILPCVRKDNSPTSPSNTKPEPHFTIPVLPDVLEEEDIDCSVNDPDYQPSSNSSDSSLLSDDDVISPEGAITDPSLSLNCNLTSEKPQVSTSVNEISGDNIGIEKDKGLSCSLTDNFKQLPGSQDTGKFKSNGEKRKGNKGKDFCFYCEDLVLNFARHIQRNHSTETEVQKIYSLPAGRKERKDLLTLLRKKGNYLNSNNNKKAMRTPVHGGNLLPCSNCLGLYTAKQLWRHRKKCCDNSDRKHQASGQNLLIHNLSVDSRLKEEVFPRMRADETSLQAKKDILICAFGARYIKLHREKHFAVVASRKMRELAKLLIEIKKGSASIRNLFEALKPKYFDLLVSAAKTIAKYNSERDCYESPSLALNIGTTLKQCCDIAIVFALKRKEVYATISAAEAEADLRSMIHLIETNWRYEISSKAASDLNMNKWNKVTLIPLASDLKLLKEHLIATANASAITLKERNDDKNAYLVLLETVFCRVMLLNRRRPGELQRMPLHIYEITEADDVQKYEEFAAVVTPSEKILMKTLKRVVIRGKRSRGVPVLFSSDVQEHIKILIEYRKNVFTKDNLYLLKKYALSSGTKNPQAITSTRLRKHLATLTQLFNMTESDIEQLATFMGHTVGVHRGSYRLPDDVYQTAKISKLLFLMEKGDTAKFKGKPIEDIEIPLDDDLLTMDEENNIDKGTRNCLPDDQPYPELEDVIPENIHCNTNSIKKSKRVLVPWSEEQKKIVTTFFAKHIRMKKPPKKAECMEVKERNVELLQNKDWLKIKVYIQNVYTKQAK